jgi:hypothetical protein
MTEFGAKVMVLSFAIGAFVSFVRWVESQPVEPLTYDPRGKNGYPPGWPDGSEIQRLRPPPPGAPPKARK